MPDETPYTPEEHHRDLRRARSEWNRSGTPTEPRKIKLSEATMDEMAASIPRRRGEPTVILTDDDGEQL